jgi:hypothetical protein
MTQSATTTVRRQVLVNAPIGEAFKVFTERFGDFKPREHNLLRAPIAETVFEPRVGGNIYDRAVDGTECRWARILAFEPPDRVVFRPFGSTQEFWNTRLVLGEGREASSCRVNYRTDAGAPFWIRSVKGAVRSIGRGADILRIGIRSAGFYALDARRTCRTMVKALGCDRDACTNGYQIRQCQPRASGLRRT